MRATEVQGPIQALRTLGDSVLGALRERVALFSLEIQEERERLLVSFVWAGSAMLVAALTLVFASFTLVYVFWDAAPLAVLGGLTAFYGLLLTTLVITLRRRLRREPRPFAATLTQIDEDRSCLQDVPS